MQLSNLLLVTAGILSSYVHTEEVASPNMNINAEEVANAAAQLNKEAIPVDDLSKAAHREELVKEAIKASKSLEDSGMSSDSYGSEEGSFHFSEWDLSSEFYSEGEL